MSLCFRPVKEIWGEASSIFVSHELMINVLIHIGDAAHTRSETHDYGEMETVWFEDGKKVLDYIESKKFSFRRLGAKVVAAPNQALASLVGNMKALATEWRKSIGKYGELVFYVD